MNASEMLDFVKATSDPERLRIIGALVQGPQTAAGLAAALNIPLRKAFNHLAFLNHVGVVLAHTAPKKQDDTYELDSDALEKLARRQFEGTRPAFSPEPDLEQKTRRVLAAHLNPDGSVRTVPLQADKLRIVLNYLVNAFEAGRTYTEKEVNTILKRFNPDTSGLRRNLVDAGLLARVADGSKYWRPA